MKVQWSVVTRSTQISQSSVVTRLRRVGNFCNGYVPYFSRKGKEFWKSINFWLSYNKKILRRCFYDSQCINRPYNKISRIRSGSLSEVNQLFSIRFPNFVKIHQWLFELGPSRQTNKQTTTKNITPPKVTK